MKILKITFQNLNSLKGAHCIDLENGLLDEAGIFSITGPTGAGKSTLLDAITLALFGKAARYEKESNPGEMMTRGTGECSAEVLFECSKGRYTAKWARIRARKKSDGKLQNPKREIAKAGSGEILAEKLREADSIIESLTGLDYHRFLRSVLLAQGRFKEFLDAGDNERGDLLEKITGTEIYSLISKRAFEMERSHDKSIQEARQKLDGVELQTEEALSALNEERSSVESTVAQLKVQLNESQAKLQHFSNHCRLNETLNQSNSQLLESQEAEKTFAPSLLKLTQHEATQPFQAALIELDNSNRQYKLAGEQLGKLEKINHQKQTATVQLLSATTRHLNAEIQYVAKKAKSIEAVRIKTKAEEQKISDWLKENHNDLTIESRLLEIRPMGESIRLLDKELARLETEQKQLNQDRLKNETTLNSEQTLVEKAKKLLITAKKKLESATNAFMVEVDDQSMDSWREVAKKQIQAVEAAKALKTERALWAKTKEELKSINEQRPTLSDQLEAAKNARNKQDAIVIKETATFEDKQKIWDQARLIATLEVQRADLKPNEACPLCGSLKHPFADHLTSNESADMQALQEQKQILAAAEKAQKQATETVNRLDEKLKALDQSILQATKNLEEQNRILKANASSVNYEQSLEDEGSFKTWQSSLTEQQIASEVKLRKLTSLERDQKTASESLVKLESDYKVSENKLQLFRQKSGEYVANIESIETEKISKSADLETQFTAFNQKLDDESALAKTPKETQFQTETLEKKLSYYKQQSDQEVKQKHALSELATQFKELNQTQIRLTEELEYWHEKLKSNLTIEETANSITLTIAEDESQRRNDCQTAIDSARESAQSLKQKREDISKRSVDIQSKTDSLKARLIDSPFTSIELLRAAHLASKELNELVTQRDALKSDQDKLLGMITQTRNELKKLENKGIITKEEAAVLTGEHTKKDEQIGIHNKRLGQIKLLFELDIKARLTQADQIKQIKVLEKEAKPWIELNALIGSASGDKFSKFAQGLTLGQLLGLANRHLLELNDRYQIRRTPESDLCLEIVDRYQADAIRPTRSLSGGESFLVSLALALGLSDLAGSDTRIESLFIDEGFGTLDTDTLDTALAALENLRMSNRTIGIISHVDALKQRISAQIRVEKGSDGFGTLEIVNGN